MLVYLLRLISSVATDKKKHFEHVHSNTLPPPSLLSLWTTRNHIVQAIAIIPFVDKLCHNIKIENPVANLFHWPNIPKIFAFPRANIDVTAELAVNYRTLFAAKQKKCTLVQIYCCCYWAFVVDLFAFRWNCLQEQKKNRVYRTGMMRRRGQIEPRVLG